MFTYYCSLVDMDLNMAPCSHIITHYVDMEYKTLYIKVESI